MRPRVLVVSGLFGAILGAAVASIGATRIFTCVEPNVAAVCASESGILALAWGVPSGLALGLIAGFILSRRQSVR